MQIITTNKLPVAVIRAMKEQLCVETSGFANPKNNGFFMAVHPYTAPKFFWSAGLYRQALQCWWIVIKQCLFEQAEPILKSIPWRD